MITATLAKKYCRARGGVRVAQLGLCCAAAAILGGCAERKVRAFPWATAVLVRPNPPIVHGDPGAIADLAPDFRIDPPGNNGKIFSVRPVPVRPRINSAQASDSVDAANTTDLVPELGAQETAVAKLLVAEGIAIAERNLAAARGRKLLPAQSDIVSKIKVFVAEAREASGEGDWARARNLAKKAQILSEDLASSL
jgi:hypothetical protein